MRPHPIVLTTGVSLVMFLVACSSDGAADDVTTEAPRQVVIDLQSGFDGLEVRIVVNGRTVAELERVVTDQLLGLAESVAVEIPGGPTEVIIGVVVGVGEEIEASTSFDAVGDRYVGVDLTGDAIVLNVSREPFGYG